MSERVIQPHKEGMKRSMKDRITSVAQRNKSTSSPPSTPEQKTPQIQKKHRPIEQVLVGAWNAVKPESQGKAIMRVYDKYIHPRYATEEERKHAKALRPKIEKIVGWTALGTEAALITFGAVKGYQKLRSIDWSTLTHKRESRLSKKKKILRVRRMGVAESEYKFGLAMAAIYDEAKTFLLTDDYARLFGDAVPEEMRNLAPEFFRRVFEKVKESDFNRILNMAHREYQNTMMYGLTRRVMDDLVRENGSHIEEYIGLLKGWFLHVGCPGIDQFGIQMKQ